MSKIRSLYRFFSIISLLCAVACVDEVVDSSDMIETEVKFSISTEGTVDTRAVSDGKKVDELICIIIDEDDNIISRSHKSLPSEFSNYPLPEDVSIEQSFGLNRENVMHIQFLTI